jgi:cardiolipin hydrolase
MIEWNISIRRMHACVRFLLLGVVVTQNSFSVHDSLSFGKTHFILGCQALPAVSYIEGKTSVEPSLQHEVLPLTKDGRVCTAFFAPDDKWYKTLLSLIEQEKESIRIAVYLLTDKRLAQALCQARMRGVVVEVVTDPSCVNDKSNKLSMLCQAGIPVYVYVPADRGIMSNLMHHKFALFTHSLYERPLVWTGSANGTQSAEFHQENILVVDDPEVCTQYKKQFERLKQRSKKCSPSKLNQNVHKKRTRLD